MYTYLILIYFVICDVLVGTIATSHLSSPIRHCCCVCICFIVIEHTSAHSCTKRTGRGTHERRPRDQLKQCTAMPAAGCACRITCLYPNRTSALPRPRGLKRRNSLTKPHRAPYLGTTLVHFKNKHVD